MQKESYRSTGSTQDLPQDFKIIFDGFVLAVAVLCPVDVEPFGVYDVRDRVREVLSSVCEYEEIPPCLTHEALVILNAEDKTWKKEKDVYIGVDAKATFESLEKNAYLTIIQQMVGFFRCCNIAQKIEILAENTHKSESLVLGDLKKFLQTSWKEFRKRRELTSRLKGEIVEILDGLSQSSQSLQELDEGGGRLAEQRKHNPVLDDLITKISERDKYLTPRKLIDTNSTMRIIEHVRSELQTYVTNTSTLLSALAGAIIGSVITLVVTYLLRV